MTTKTSSCCCSCSCSDASPRFTLPEDIIERIKQLCAGGQGESFLIPVLQDVQNRFGYLSKEHMDEVSQLMQIPAARVTGVATFYHFFRFTPKGKHKVTVCLGTACFVRGADKVLARLKELLGVDVEGTTKDGQFSLSCARCLGACALAPVVLVDEKVFAGVKPDDLPKILSEFGFKARK